MKKKIRVQLAYISCDEFEGTIDGIKKYLDSLSEAYTPHENLLIEIDYFPEGFSHKLTGEREETDTEYKNRLACEEKKKAQEKKTKQKKIESERRQLLKLLKKHKDPSTWDQT